MKVREQMEKANNISEIINTCGYYPLNTEERIKFYVDTSAARGVDVLSELKNSFFLLPNNCQQVLFLGHIGSGKSTLLYQLEQSLYDKYKIIRFSVQEFLDIKEMTFADLLCAMYQVILDSCDDLTDEENDSLTQVYRTWYDNIVKETEYSEDASIQLTAEAGLSVKTVFLNLLSKFNSSLKYGTVDKTTIKSHIGRDIDDYIEMLNELISISDSHSSKPLLLMFEDLEKIPKDKAEDIFLTKAYYFRKIKANMLLTTPIYLKYYSEFRSIISQNYSSFVRCPIIAVIEPNTNLPSRDGVELLKTLIWKRVSKELIEEAALEDAIMFSGGVIRDLLWIICEAAKRCMNNKSEVIEQKDIKHGFEKLQEIFGDGLRGDKIEKIKNVYANPYSLIQDEEELKLMRSEIIIEYNCKQWRGIHPAVEEHLIQLGVLDRKTKFKKS